MMDFDIITDAASTETREHMLRGLRAAEMLREMLAQYCGTIQGNEECIIQWYLLANSTTLETTRVEVESAVKKILRGMQDIQQMRHACDIEENKTSSLQAALESQLQAIDDKLQGQLQKPEPTHTHTVPVDFERMWTEMNEQRTQAGLRALKYTNVPTGARSSRIILDLVEQVRNTLRELQPYLQTPSTARGTRPIAKVQQAWAQMNQHRVQVGLRPIECPSVPPEFTSIRVLIEMSERVRNALDTMEQCMRELMEKRHDTMHLDEIIQTTRSLQATLTTQQQSFTDTDIKHTRAFEDIKRRSCNEIQAKVEQVALNWRLPSKTIARIVHDTADKSSTEQLILLKGAVYAEIQSKMAAPMATSVGTTTAHASTDDPSHFVLVTYGHECESLTIDTLGPNGASRVWSCAYSSHAKCSYVEYTNPTTSKQVHTFLDAAGVALCPIYGCSPMTTLVSEIRTHPAMLQIMRECCTARSGFVFTCLEGLNMLEPPFALATETRVAMWNKQVHLANTAPQELATLREFGGTGNSEQHDHQEIFTRLLHAFADVRILQNHLLVDLQATTLHLGMRTIRQSRCIAKLQQAM